VNYASAFPGKMTFIQLSQVFLRINEDVPEKSFLLFSDAELLALASDS
jgi:hypothetical protein